MTGPVAEGFAAHASRLRATSHYLHDKALRHRQTVEWAERESAAVRATASAADGSVVVTVDPTGMLTELTLAPEAMRRMTNTELAHLITDTARQATANARNQVRDTYQGLVDEGAIRRLPAHLLSAPQVPQPPRAHRDDDGEPQSWLNDLA